MRTLAWLAALAMVVFALGYVTGLLTVRVEFGEGTEASARDAERRGPGDRASLRDGGDESCDRERSRGKGGRRGKGGDRRSRDRRGGYDGFLDSIERLADEIGLSDPQRRELDALLARTADGIAEHERAIANRLLSARRAVEDLLTDEQRAEIQRRIEEQFRAMREARVAELRRWLRDEGGLSGGDLEAAGRVVAGWMNAKGAYFHGLRRQGRWPSKGEMSARLEQLSLERDAELASYLDAPTLERFRGAASNYGRWHRH